MSFSHMLINLQHQPNKARGSSATKRSRQSTVSISNFTMKTSKKTRKPSRISHWWWPNSCHRFSRQGKLSPKSAKLIWSWRGVQCAHHQWWEPWTSARNATLRRDSRWLWHHQNTISIKESPTKLRVTKSSSQRKTPLSWGCKIAQGDSYKTTYKESRTKPRRISREQVSAKVSKLLATRTGCNKQSKIKRQPKKCGSKGNKPSSIKKTRKLSKWKI